MRAFVDHLVRKINAIFNFGEDLMNFV